MTSARGSWSVWLIISLVVNALLIGFVFGGGIRHRVHTPDQDGPGPRGGFEMVRGLDQIASEEDRDEIRRVFRDVFRETRDVRREQRRARIAFAQAAAADPYDEAQVLESLKRVREAGVALETEIHAAMASQLGRLDVDQRRALIRAMSQDGRQGRRGPPRREGGERRGPGD
ncbi:MAG: periplasmic heavy metal sensor [Pseudomonadota bacterium]